MQNWLRYDWISEISCGSVREGGNEGNRAVEHPGVGAYHGESIWARQPSSPLTPPPIASESPLAPQSISSWSPSTLRHMVMMSGALIEDEGCLTTHLGGSLLTGLIDSASSSSVLPSDSVSSVVSAFVSFSPVSIVPASPPSASRSRKRAHESFSSALKKRSRLTSDHCGCTLSSKWLDDLK
jgi:hypothetical protein